MPDLRATAKRLRKSAAINAAEVRRWPSTETPVYKRAFQQAADDHTLAAQALEALAWQAETGASVREMGSGGFFCAVNGDEIVNNYYADTPLGALLAAMEGEKKDGRD